MGHLLPAGVLLYVQYTAIYVEIQVFSSPQILSVELYGGVWYTVYMWYCFGLTLYKERFYILLYAGTLWI